MNGQFGRRDWLANGVLFAGYHLHMPWVIPTTLLDTFILSYPSKRYRSTLISIAVHSAEHPRARARARVGAQGLSTAGRPRSAGVGVEATLQNGPPNRRPVPCRYTSFSIGTATMLPHSVHEPS
jgi:hypothetical protein